MKTTIKRFRYKKSLIKFIEDFFKNNKEKDTIIGHFSIDNVTRIVHITKGFNFCVQRDTYYVGIIGEICPEHKIVEIISGVYFDTFEVTEGLGVMLEKLYKRSIHIKDIDFKV